MPFTIAVVGPAQAQPDELQAAEEVGRLLAAGGHVVVTGGHGGVMEAAARGAAINDGVVVGILPGLERDANPYVTIGLPTGLGEMRNALIVRSADAVICVGTSWGSLSEVSLAMRTRIPVVMVGGWNIPEGPQRAEHPGDAVRMALRLAHRRRHP
ncbi:MAG TPA: TIGR00725 family protein [Actinomycetota bacterium]|nr:TIGR00725 family protein [Actinomycetota bacterium]HNL51506.1 TIGR00725 family protein [Actinomycetota bacterium]